MRLFNRLRLHIVQRNWKRAPGKLLDVGCGKGKFLHEARSAGWECVGIEPTERSWRVAIEEYGLDVITKPLREDLFPPESFHIVTLWHTLEHITDPAQVIRTALRWLKPAGLAIIAIPNIASLQAHIGGSLWFHLDPPRHLSHFTVETATKLLVSCGFDKIKVHFFYPELNDLGMIQTILNRLGFSPNLLFNLLKRNWPGLPSSKAKLALNVLGALLVILIAWPFLLTMTRFEEWTGRGGTMILIGQKPAREPKE